MTLADDIAQRAAAPTRRLRADIVLAELGKKDRDDLRAALADPAVRPVAITEAMGARNVSLSDTAIRKWRRVNGVAL